MNSKRSYQYPIELNAMPQSAGIYRITDVVSGKFYVGGTDNLYRRLTNHCRDLQKDVNSCIRLQEKFNDHKNIFNIKIEYLELCTDDSVKEYEQHYLDTLLFAQEYIKGLDNRFMEIGLNVYPTAESAYGSKKTDDQKIRNRELQKVLQKGERNGMYGRKHTEESKAKIGNANKGANLKIKGEKHYLFGKHHSEEVKRKISEGGKGRVVSAETRIKNGNASRGRKFSEEAKRKISETKKLMAIRPKNVCKRIHQIDENGLVVRVYEAMTDVIKEHNLSYFLLNRILKGKKIAKQDCPKFILSD